MDPKQRTMRRDFDLVFDGIKAYTKTIDGKEVKFLGGCVSSTAQDLYGDVIGPEGQVKMLAKLRHLADELKDQNSGLTAWVNHSYKIPEDTLGAFTSASMTTRTGDGVDGEAGVEYIDLDIECRVTDTNPRAVAAWEQVKDGIRHGWSIGAIFTEAEWLSDDPDSPDFWSLYVTDLNLLEISLVGIPANQRAWCKSKDDLKAKAVEEAERIARDAKEIAERGTPLEQRGLVLKSLVQIEDTADSTTTAPLTARAAGNPMFPAATAAATPGATYTVTVDTTANAPAVAVAEPEPKTADPVAEGREVASTVLRLRNLQQLSAEIQASVKDALGAFSVAVQEDTMTEEDRKAFDDALASIKAMSDAELRETGKEEAVKTLTALAEKYASDADVNLALACALEALSVEPAPISAKATKLGGALRELGGDDVTKALAAQAADAIDVLVKASQVQKDGTPDDERDRIALAIGHIAKAVGHGICARAAQHLSKACVELSAAVGNEVQQPGPSGDETPDTLEVTPENIASIDGEIEAKRAELTEADNALTAKRAELTETTSVLESKQAEIATIESTLTEKQTALADLETKTAEAQARFAELDAKIKAAEEVRMGRKSMVPVDFAQRFSDDKSTVKPEHYTKNALEQRDALARQVSGDDKLTGRDMAAAS